MVKSSDEEDQVLSYPIDSHSFGFQLNGRNEFYIEENGKPAAVYSIKRVKLPHKGEDWKIFVDGEEYLVVKGTRFSKKERAYFHTPAGISFLINQCKLGAKNISQIKENLKGVKL